MSTLENKGIGLTDEILRLKEQIEKLSIEIRKCDFKGSSCSQIVKWRTEKLIHAERLKRTLKNLESKSNLKEQRALLRNLDIKIDDIIKSIKAYEEKHSIDYSPINTRKLAGKRTVNNYIDKKHKLGTVINDKAKNNYSFSYESNRNPMHFGIKSIEADRKRIDTQNYVLDNSRDQYKSLQGNTGNMMEQYKTSSHALCRSNSAVPTVHKRNIHSISTIPNHFQPNLSESKDMLEDPKLSQKITEMNTNNLYLVQELGKEKRLNRILTSEFNKLKIEHEFIIKELKENESKIEGFNKEIASRNEIIRKSKKDQEVIAEQYKESLEDCDKLHKIINEDSEKIKNFKSKLDEQTDEINDLKRQLAVLNQEIVS